MYKHSPNKSYADVVYDNIQNSKIASNQTDRSSTAIVRGLNGINFIFFIMALVFCSNASAVTGDEDVQDSSSPVSSFWISVAKSAGSDVGGAVAGYALSALGLSGASQEDADLTEIINLLTEVDAELQELVDEVQALECVTGQDSTTLTKSIKNIQGLYDAYSSWVNGAPTVPCWEQSDDSSNICFGQTGVRTWLNEVIDPENGVNADLDAINDLMIQAGNTGVIYNCVKDITTNYNNSDGPKKYVFDWTGDSNNPGYYDQVQSLTNYYYGIQAQGAALLSEASHLQACLSLGTSNCQFAGQSADNEVTPVDSGATPSNPGDICANAEAGSIAAEDCINAQNSVVKIYGYIKAQLVQAGAPYTNDLIGFHWSSWVAYTKSLEDFTNKATVNGKVLSDCDTPLSSLSPCGFTVGAYNHSFPNKNNIDYAGYSHWGKINGHQQAMLLSTYTDGTSGYLGGTLGQWMNSVGFTTATNKIITTISTGNNWGAQTICFMDTSLARSAHRQPWCDSGGGYAQSTGTLAQEDETSTFYIEYSQANFTGSSIRPDFYTMKLKLTMDYSTDSGWINAPGWLAEEQGNSKFQHFQWGGFILSDLPICTVRTIGGKASNSLNPGGIPSMCGSNLQAWLDIVLPEPQVPVGTLPILVTRDLHLHIHSALLETSDGQQSNIWAYLNFVGTDRNGDMVWKLMRWGQEFGVPRLAPSYASVFSDLRIEIQSAIYQGESGDQDIWANLFYSGADTNGDHFWTLEEFGVN